MSLSKILDSQILIGLGAKIDPLAELGEKSARVIPDYRLIIGKNATIRSGCVLYAGSVIGDNLNLGHHVVIREENRLGDDVSVWGNTTIDYGCTIGHRVKLHTSVYVAQFTIIEDDVFLAPGVVIANDPHPGCPRSRECMRGPTIKKGAQIGVNVTIVPFVTIGEFALIGAGAVVTKNIPARSVAYGNPARVVGKIEDLRCIMNPVLLESPYTHIPKA